MNDRQIALALIETKRAEAGVLRLPVIHKPLPRRSRWQRIKDEVARWRRK